MSCLWRSWTPTPLSWHTFGAVDLVLSTSHPRCCLQEMLLPLPLSLELLSVKAAHHQCHYTEYYCHKVCRLLQFCVKHWYSSSDAPVGFFLALTGLSAGFLNSSFLSCHSKLWTISIFFYCGPDHWFCSFCLSLTQSPGWLVSTLYQSTTVIPYLLLLEQNKYLT